jgi:hypothetical protein
MKTLLNIITRLIGPDFAARCVSSCAERMSNHVQNLQPFHNVKEDSTIGEVAQPRELHHQPIPIP